MLQKELKVHLNQSIKRELDIPFSKFQEAIISSLPPIVELQWFLENSYNYLHPQIVHFISINKILTDVRHYCTLIDTSCLEGIMDQFDINNAKTHIQM